MDRAPSLLPPLLPRRIAALALLTLCAGARAVPVAIPNGDFSNPANQGSVGGLIGSGNRPIGSGPWSGRWNGILDLLAAPTLAIGSGQARIDGLIGVNVGGLLNNGGAFEQTLSAPWQPNRRYTLTADVTTTSVLDLPVLYTGNVGIGLARSATRVASSATSDTVTIGLLQGSTYRVQLVHDTGATVSGNLGVHLFAEPVGLLTANLLGTVSFDNVTLDSRALNQVPGGLAAIDATPRRATVDQVVDPALAIRVLDTEGDPIEGISVNWTVPSSGAGARVTPNPTLTGADGIARPTVTANTIAGSYAIHAQVAGIAAPVRFDLTNLPGAPSALDGASGSGQSAVGGAPFAAPLVVEVRDAFGNAVPGVTVAFSAPAGGASATLPAPVTTGSDGRAQITPIANAIAGRYQVHATVAGVGTSAAFTLTNLLDPSVEPIGDGEPSQNATVESLFSCALLVRVSDGGQPRAGLAVEFSAPPSGPSATLSDGVDSGSTLRVDTDAEGYAWVTATANGIAGDYVVNAYLLYSLAPPIEFRLHNLAANDPLYASGFDGACIPAAGPDSEDRPAD